MKKTILSLVLIITFANSEMIRSGEKEIVLDTDTKLMWQDNLEAKTVEKSWQGAIDYCYNLTLAGFDDWSLPDKDTLKSLYYKKDYLTNLSSGNYSSGYYWSSSPNVSDVGYAWDVTFWTAMTTGSISPIPFMLGVCETVKTLTI